MHTRSPVGGGNAGHDVQTLDTLHQVMADGLAIVPPMLGVSAVIGRPGGRAIIGGTFGQEIQQIIRFVDQYDNPLFLKEGNTWVQVVPQGFEVEAE